MGDDEHLISEVDDDYHRLTGHWWDAETVWFSWNVPERNMGGWLYALSRPTIGTCAGGAWVWDDTGVAPWELPYYQNFNLQRLPEERSLHHIAFPVGLEVKMVEPLTEYELRYHDAGRLEIDFRFRAITPPVPVVHGKPPFTASAHFDQPGRVWGTMVLNGEPVAVDSLSVRDRSWGPRSERRKHRIGYAFGTASPTSGFLAFSAPSVEQDDVTGGYVLRHGHRTRLVSGLRRVERDPAKGWITAIEVEATDDEGQPFAAVGRAVSRMAIPMATSATWNTLLRWEFDGGVGWGEDQDVYPYAQWVADGRGRP